MPTLRCSRSQHAEPLCVRLLSDWVPPCRFNEFAWRPSEEADSKDDWSAGNEAGRIAAASEQHGRRYRCAPETKRNLECCSKCDGQEGAPRTEDVGTLTSGVSTVITPDSCVHVFLC
ncbi:uncharacterized protein LOC143030570 [Oratosquilla oratoria]|uniref:uncharacterized protein LOC143030570 n=1 Tax=Oratosquilla oratoria TaxID=337810 RepID=UPI003F75BC15